MQFSKYHGCGNHFIITGEDHVTGQDYGELAVRVCDPHIGIGGDGFIIVRSSPLEMLFYNMDGSPAPMCGNGIRCFAHYCKDEGICTEPSYMVKTGAGDMRISVSAAESFAVKVNMGKPDFSPKSCGIIGEEAPFLHRDLDGVEVNTFFMGTIHTVVWSDEFTDWASIGQKISCHPVYREKTNVNFAKITAKNRVAVKTYERGVGVTMACGTGACAVAVLGWLEGKFTGDVEVQLPYGELTISRKEDNSITMEGPSERIFTGIYPHKGEQKL